MMKRLLAMLLVLCLPLTALAENPVWVGPRRTEDYVRETPIDMPAGDAYQVQPWGVTTWRGGSFRQNAAVGTLDGAAIGLELAWTAQTGALHLDANERFWGFSWYSQPAIVKWPKEVRQSMITLTDEARSTAGLREVIFPSLDGKIYFLRMLDGTATRAPIDVGYPLMGAATLHPLGFPMMLVGQYSDMLRHGRGSIGAHWYELLTQHSIRFVDGRMEALGVDDAYTGAFNTSALIDYNTNTAVSLSKDGYLYTVQLDTRLYADDTRNELSRFEVDFAPAVIAKVTEGGERVTTAPAMHSSLLYFGSSEGRLRCIDTTTMQTRWTLQLTGSFDATPALEMTAEGLVLYAGTQDAILCLDAVSGETIWQLAMTEENNLAYQGAFSSPVVGQHELDGLVFFAVSQWASKDGLIESCLLALDKETGAIVWRQWINAAEASPVAVYAANGRGWLIHADRYGGMKLLDGASGAVVDNLFLDMRDMSSPAVYGDMLVIGGKTDDSGRIFGVRIVTAEEPAPAALTAEQQAIADFMTAWSRNDRHAMLDLCAPSWRAQQADADKQLFLLIRNRLLMAWRMADEASSGQETTCAVEVWVSGQWHRLLIPVLHEGGAWYVDPDALQHMVRIDDAD